MLLDIFEEICDHVIEHRKQTIKLSHFYFNTALKLPRKQIYDEINSYLPPHYVFSENGGSCVRDAEVMSIMISYFVDKTILALNFNKNINKKAFDNFVYNVTHEYWNINLVYFIYKEIIHLFKPFKSLFWTRKRYIYIKNIKYSVQYKQFIPYSYR